MKVVIDTNVILSGLRPTSTPPSSVLIAWYEDVFTLVMSPETRKELHEVLNRDYWVTRLEPYREYAKELVEKIDKTAMICTDLPSDPLPVRDPKDKKFLAVALASRADYLVTGDDDLLVLGEYKGVLMVTAREFDGVLKTRARNAPYSPGP